MKLHTVKTIFTALIGALLLIGCENSESKGQSNSSKDKTDASVVLVEYSDFECPACAYFYPIVKKMEKKYGDELEIKYRYFPLNSHQYSMLAARAAEAAHNQGKYMEMHDLLFENQSQWAAAGNPQSIFINYAKKLDLDMAKFKDDLNSSETQKEVMQQKNEGINKGVSSTPSFFINGKIVDPLPRTYDQFKDKIDSALQQAKMN